MILRQSLNLNSYCLLSKRRSLKTQTIQRKFSKQQLIHTSHIDTKVVDRNAARFGKTESISIAVSPTEYKWWIRLKPLVIFLVIQSIPLSLGAYVYKRLLDSKIDILNTILDDPKDIFNHCLKVIRSASACFLITGSTNSLAVQLVDTLNPQEDISLDTLLSDIKNNTDSTKNAGDITIIFPIPSHSPLIDKFNSQITLVYYSTNKSSIVYLTGVVEKVDKTGYWKNSWYSNIDPPYFDLYQFTPISLTTSLFGCGQRDWQQYSIGKIGGKWAKV